MKKGDLAVKAVRYTLNRFYPVDYPYFSIEVGETYQSDEGFSVCDSVPATFEFYPYPVLTKYLEVEILGEVEEIDQHSFKTNEIKIIREIPFSELKMNREVVQYWSEWDKPEKKEEMKSVLLKEQKESFKRRTKNKIELFLYTVLLFVIIPIVIIGALIFIVIN